ncbi:hypothetical protein [Streptomyces sp. enrichment culture]|uniref:hypothetical protein n=1 Tax=Streptomyces sp. enrichment culture TaxID=1795815 RepID=UPI003F553A35
MIGIFVDIGLTVGGFVDVVLLPREAKDWPVEGTVTDFEIWWADEHRQIRLKPSDPQYLCDDFTDFVERFRPGWPSDIGRPVHDRRRPPRSREPGPTLPGRRRADGPGGSQGLSGGSLPATGGVGQ